MPRPFIPAPNTASVELIYLAGGYVLENVFHVRKSSPFSLADLQALRAVFDTWDNSYWKNQRFATCTLTRIRTKALDTDSSPQEDYSLATPRAGTQGGSLSPLNCTFAIKLASSSAGRSARGRIYIPTIPSGAVATAYGTIAASYANAVVGYLTTLLTTLSGAGYTLCITSYRHLNAWRSEAVNYDVTTVTYTDLNMDSQRRRLPGRGRT